MQEPEEKKIALELLETEQAYVNRLHLLDQVNWGLEGPMQGDFGGIEAEAVKMRNVGCWSLQPKIWSGLCLFYISHLWEAALSQQRLPFPSPLGHWDFPPSVKPFTG